MLSIAGQCRFASAIEMSSEKLAAVFHWEILSSLDSRELEYLPSGTHKIQANNQDIHACADWSSDMNDLC